MPDQDRRMITVDVKADVRGAKRYLKRIGEKGVTRAAYRAINKAGAAAFTVGKRAVAKDLRVPQKEIKDRFDLRKASARRPTATVAPNRAGWRPIGLLHYVAKSRRHYGAFSGQKGVRYKQPRGSGNRVLKGAFIAPGRNESGLHVFIRAGSKRTPIVRKTGPIPATSLRLDDVRRAVNTRAREVFGREFSRQLKREIEKAAR